MHHSSTSTYIPNFIGIGKTFWTDGRTYLRTDVRTDGHLRPILLCRLFGVDLISQSYNQKTKVACFYDSQYTHTYSIQISEPQCYKIDIKRLKVDQSKTLRTSPKVLFNGVFTFKIFTTFTTTKLFEV